MDYDNLSSGDITHLISLIKDGRPDIEGSRALLRLFCHRAKKLKFPASPFPEPLLGLLVSTFESYLSGEGKDLEKLLGLKRRGKPPNREIEKRNIFIAHQVLCLTIEGNQLVDNSAKQGAFSIVGEANMLSDSEVRDIYYKYQIEAYAMEISRRFNEKEKD